MKILLAVEGSSCSDAAVEMAARQTWPAGTEVRVISVVKPHAPLSSGPKGPAIKYYEDVEMAERQKASKVLEQAARLIGQHAGQNGGPNITTELLSGSPKRVIVEEARRWAADLIILGSHDYKSLERRLLGSVSQAVASQATCPVEIVRSCPSA